MSGEVTRPTLKKDVERVVKSIEGVQAVENHIKVLPPSPQDDRLRTVLYQAIYHNPALSRYAMTVISPIRIIVDNGKVTLEGAVDNQSDKDLANILAKSVPACSETGVNFGPFPTEAPGSAGIPWRAPSRSVHRGGARFL